MKYINGTIKAYLKDLGAKLPAPGGGSAAGLSSSLAASLLSMVCHYTVGKEKYKKFERRVMVIHSKSLQLQKRLSDLVDEDVKAYRSKDMDRSTKVPAEICLLSYDLMSMAVELLDKGSKNLISDTALAALLAEAGFFGGFFYVKVNLKYLGEKGKKYDKLYREVKTLLIKVKKMRKKVEVKIGCSIGW